MEASNPTCPPSDDLLLPETAVSDPGDLATEEAANATDEGSQSIALAPSLPEVKPSLLDGEFSLPADEFSQADTELSWHEPVDDLEVVQCLRCTALLPCYARYCLHCGTLQEATRASDGPAQAEPMPDDALSEGAPVDAVPPVLQVLAEQPLPEPVSPPEPTIMDLLRAEQQRVVEKLTPLESDRHWWRKYFSR